MKKTKNRQKILTFLQKNKKAFTASQLHSHLEDIDLATIYRNLNLFVEQNIIRELRLTKGESMYEYNTDGHEHAVCSKCGKIRHIEIDKEKLKSALSLSDFQVEDIEINIKGHCK